MNVDIIIRLLHAQQSNPKKAIESLSHIGFDCLTAVLKLKADDGADRLRRAVHCSVHDGVDS